MGTPSIDIPSLIAGSCVPVLLKITHSGFIALRGRSKDSSIVQGKQIDAQQQTLTLLFTRIDELEEREKGLQDAADEREKKFRDTISRLEGRIESLEMQRNSNLQELAQREVQLDRATKKLLEQEDYIRTLECDNAKLSEHIETLRKSIGAKQSPSL